MATYTDLTPVRGLNLAQDPCALEKQCMARVLSKRTPRVTHSIDGLMMMLILNIIVTEQGIQCLGSVNGHNYMKDII